MLIFCLSALAVVVSGFDPPEFVVEEEGEYVISVDWYGKPSGNWVDGYLVVNENSIESFHGLVKMYNGEDKVQYPPSLDSRNSFPYLKVGDVVWIHSEQTDQLANTRLSVQKMESFTAEHYSGVKDVGQVHPVNSDLTNYGKSDSSEVFVAAEAGSYSFTWKIYGTSSCSDFWIRAHVLKNGELLEGTELQVYNQAYD